MQIKYTIRRAIAGIVIVPATAGLYFAGYAVLVGLGATATATATEVWNNGLVLGALTALSLIFWEKFTTIIYKLGGAK